MSEERLGEVIPIRTAVETWLDRRGRELEEQLPEQIELDAVAEQQRRDAAKQERLRLLVETRGIPFRHATRLLFGTLEDSQALRVVAEWRDRRVPGSILVLSGRVDSGKTMAAEPISAAPGRPSCIHVSSMRPRFGASRPTIQSMRWRASAHARSSPSTTWVRRAWMTRARRSP
jgi:hypothetical protein